VFLHSSTGAHLARIAARQAGVEVTLEVTIVDALVLARSAFHHSVNYRAVVAHGRATLLARAEDKQEILDALMDKVFPGRLGAVRAPTANELRQTAVLALPLLEVSAKVLTGPPEDEPEDLSRVLGRALARPRGTRRRGGGARSGPRYRASLLSAKQR